MKPKAHFFTLAVAVASLATLQAQSPSTNDLWDISQGVTITSHSSFDAALGGPDPYDARDLFGGRFGNYVPERDLHGGVVFDDLVPDDHIHYVEWHTPTPVTVRSFFLFARGDYPGQQAREFATFTLKAKSPGSATYDLTLYTFTPEHPYVYVDAQTGLLLSAGMEAVAAQDFRAEFANLPGQFNSGPRIIELDGFSTPVPAHPPLIVVQPTGQSAVAGGTATFAVTASGTAPLRYQWRFDGTNISGATGTSLTLTNVQFANAGSYSVVISNVAGTVTSSNAVLSVNSFPATALWNVNFAGYEAVKTGWAATGLSTNDYWNRYTAPWQNFAGLSNLKLADGTPTTVGLTVENGAGHWGFAHPDLMYNTYCYAQNFGTITLTLTNLPTGEYDLYLFGHGGAHTENTVFQLLAGGTDWGMQSTATNGSWALTNWVEGAQYVVYRSVTVTNGGAPLVVKVHPGLSRYTHLNGLQVSSAGATPPSPPMITAQPQNQSVTVGGNVIFNVTAMGQAPLSFQWRFNGTNINGATTGSLELTNVQLSHAGDYSVVVSNSIGSTISSNATLTVNLPPASVIVQSVSAAAGGSVALPIGLMANGNENALGFSLSFNNSLLNYTGVTLGGGATGATLLVNTNQVASGKLGVAVALATDETFAAGPHEVVSVEFTTAVVINGTETSVSFDDVPIARQVSDAPGSALTASYDNGIVSIAAVLYEGDVAPRPDGNRSATITDWVLEGRYVARLDYPTNAAEFQRADCAPRSALGDGAISVTDWVQAGRYAAALDPLTPLGGPSSEVGPAAVGSTVSAAGENEREISVTHGMLLHNQAGAVGVNLTALGNENALGFSVSFDPAKLSYAGASLGSGAAGASIHVNASGSGIGKLGFALALGSGISFAAGTQEVVRIDFTAATPTTCDALLTLTDQPVPREVSNPGASPLAASYVSGTVSVNPLPALRITQANENVLLSWPLWASNFVLQQAGPALSPGSWTNLDGSVNTVNGEKVLTMPLVGGARFYRLHLP